jgi:hypothetical protein
MNANFICAKVDMEKGQGPEAKPTSSSEMSRTLSPRLM